MLVGWVSCWWVGFRVGGLGFVRVQIELLGAG